MDLQNTWKREDDEDKMLRNLLQQSSFRRTSSMFPLKILKRNLLVGTICGLLFNVCYILLFFLIDLWQVYIPLVIVIVFNVWLIQQSWQLYKRTPATVNPSKSVKEELDFHYQRFQQWWTIQQRVSVFVYPFAIAGGFILGVVEGSGKSLEFIIYKPPVLILLLLTIVIATPVCYYFARWMYRHAYGKHLKKLHRVISELTSIEA